MSKDPIGDILERDGELLKAKGTVEELIRLTTLRLRKMTDEGFYVVSQAVNREAKRRLRILRTEREKATREETAAKWMKGKKRGS